MFSSPWNTKKWNTSCLQQPLIIFGHDSHYTDSHIPVKNQSNILHCVWIEKLCLEHAHLCGHSYLNARKNMHPASDWNLTVPVCIRVVVFTLTWDIKGVLNLTYPTEHESDLTFVQISVFKFWDKHIITNASWFCESVTLYSQNKTITSAHNCILNVSTFLRKISENFLLQHFRLSQAIMCGSKRIKIELNHPSRKLCI
jgi:hypothetical protein